MSNEFASRRARAARAALGRTRRGLAAALLLPALAGAQAPGLTGVVTTDPARGLLAGDVCLSGLPPGDTVRFLLHTGLNVGGVRDSAGRSLPFRGYYDGRMIGEALEYTVTDTARGRRTLCVTYTGAFPVYRTRESSYDAKGVIAFTGQTVRASEQAKWYPVLYDSASARLSEAVTYRLRIACPACSRIYVGGSAPAAGPEHEFSSATPRALLLFAGDFTAREVAGTWYLNSTVADAGMRQISRTVAGVQQFYERMVAVPFQDSLVLIESDGIDQARSGGRVWGFTTWPTIVFAGVPFTQLAEGLAAPGTATDWALPFMAHELAHYYYGGQLRAVGALQGFFVESIAEYMSIRAIRRFQGDSAARAAVRAHARAALKIPNWVRLDRVTRDGQVSDAYRYRYGPVLLVALERQFGPAQIDRLLHNLLATPSGTQFDYDLLRRAAVQAGVTKAAWSDFELHCVFPAPAASCVAPMAAAG